MKNQNRPEGHRPGDFIINRYMPNATPEQKEEARENLKRLAALIIRVNERLAREEQEKQALREKFEPARVSDESGLGETQENGTTKPLF